MNNLNPEERRAKADEIARLLENEPLLVDDLKNLLSPPTFQLFKVTWPALNRLYEMSDELTDSISNARTLSLRLKDEILELLD